MRKVKPLLPIFLLLLALPSIACEVSGPKLLIVDKDKGAFPFHAFNYKKCSEKAVKALENFLSDFEGHLNQRTLQAETRVSFTKVSNTEVASLNTLLNERVTKDKSWRFVKSELTGTNTNYIAINESESMTVRCSNCSNTGLKNIKIEVRDPINSRFKAHWMTTQLAARTTALFPKDSLPVNNRALLPSQFEARTVYEVRPEQFFTDKSKLVFYKTNKPKSKGEAIRFQDLTPVNLVNMGQPVKVILKNNNLTLETSAIPSQSGKLGQRIRLKNPRTKKVIIGKVIHFNKVEVEL